jgi:hypothetical protein
MLFAGGLLVGAALSVLPAPMVAGGSVMLLVLIVVGLRPHAGAYLLLALTPLLAGVDRGSAIPLLRPTEALAALVGAGLIARGVLMSLASGFPRIRPSRMDLAILVLVVASSIFPFLWMLVRGLEVTSDDVLYALVLWKFAAIYLIFRIAVKTEAQVRTCLWIAMTTGAIVAVIAMLQALGLSPVVVFLHEHFSSNGNAPVASNRGGSTLGLPIAAADLLLLDLTIAVGFLATGVERSGGLRHMLLLVVAVLCVAGVVASGEFSALIGLFTAIVLLVVVTRRRRILTYLVPASCVGLIGLWPVLERRLAGFQSVNGLPVSWAGRIYNLTNYFWPELFSHERYLLGVRLAARVVVPTQVTGYVWIESGYTWLLWSGGIPLVLAFACFAYVGIRRGIRVARSRHDGVGVVALTTAVGLSVIVVLMLFDPHLTYRGAADLLFALLALAAVRSPRPTPS